jgi:hypothetical protein
MADILGTAGNDIFRYRIDTNAELCDRVPTRSLASMRARTRSISRTCFATSTLGTCIGGTPPSCRQLPVMPSERWNP